MPHTITLQHTVTVGGGPQIVASRALTLDAYDTLDVTIPADGAPHSVEVQPDDGAQLRLLTITAASYDPPLAWEADASGTTRQLDQPVVLAGASLTSLVGTPANAIAFTNGGPEDRTVRILVGRQAAS